MLIYNSMIIWIAVISILYELYMQKKKSIHPKNFNVDNERKIPFFIAVATFGYIIFWVGMRSGVADTRAYITMFQNTPSTLETIPQILFSNSKAPGFDAFNIIFKTIISDDYHVWLMALALLTGILVMLTLRKHSLDFMYSAFLFIVTLNFFWMLNGMRQFLVAVILFYLSDWLKEGKIIAYIVAILLLSTVHFTALIIIPMCWFVKQKPFGARVWLLLVLILTIVVCIEPVVSTLEIVMTDTGYSGFSEQFAQDDGVNPIRVLVMSVSPLLAFAGRRQLEEDNDEYINICVNMSVVAAGLYFVGVFTSGILVGRLPIYFELYNLILLPYLIKRCFNLASSRLMYVFCTIGFLSFYYLQMKESYYISELTGYIGK